MCSCYRIQDKLDCIAFKSTYVVFENTVISYLWYKPPFCVSPCSDFLFLDVNSLYVFCFL